MNPCFAIINSNTLESSALNDILWELFNHVEIHQYDTVGQFIRDSNRHFVHFFVSSELLFSNSEEFETLKHMTTVLSNGTGSNIQNSGFHILDTSSSEEAIMESLIELKRTGHYESARENLDESPQDNVRKLSGREKEVLRLMVKGLINKEIARELNISTTTVIFHRNNICDKLQTRSLGKLTIYAVLSGIVDIKDI